MPAPWPLTPPTAADRAAYADAEPRPFWLAGLPAREPSPPLRGAAEADLCIVGGGFTGLWAALQAKADDPGREVALLEAETIGFGASGRNGGFAIGSLTHGLENGLARFGEEIELLERLGRENMAGYVADLGRHGIDCDYEPTGELTPSVAAYQDGWAAETADLYGRFGYEVEVFADAAAMRAEVDSPLYRGGAWVKDAGGVLDPAKLVLGLYEAALRAGVRVYERTAAVSIEEAGGRGGRAGSGGGAGGRLRASTLSGGRAAPPADAPVVVRTPGGTLTARRVVVGTSAYPSPVGSVRRYIAPVYDYALMSEPLSPEQLRAIGWGRRQGIGDGGNRFHYYRLSADNRILWGGFDAVYRYGGPVNPGLDDHDETFARLVQNFRVTFPQLESLRFTHRWGGAIDTCSRFSVFFGTTLGGRVAYAAGYTGLGVMSTRFGARVALDLVDGRETEATRSRYVRRKPVPFPPEPLRSAVIQLTRNRLAAADARDGRRGMWLGLLDRLGLGFDS
ncbi:MAG TPA: FAD-binding oxidoreductase [Solirubrobacterales bacterium]|jgi:glycine/D-amino acid oxidase-like deaminating enzyme|nr:FAD-binding oxidoreductase [Solirubrobacterales bacterium]